jgi:hypothetical protein
MLTTKDEVSDSQNLALDHRSPKGFANDAKAKSNK